MQHLIRTNDFSLEEIQEIYKDAALFKSGKIIPLLQDKMIFTMFFENSTRTRSSFEVAAKRLGANIVHLNVEKCSIQKGETLIDTAVNLDAMGPNAIIVRHSTPGVPLIISEHTNASIINAGDGINAHPTQALLDSFTLYEHFDNLEGKTIAIVGDIKNSRVANSNIELLSRLGMNIILVCHPIFLPETKLRYTNKLEDIIDVVDVIMSLRTQTERHEYSNYSPLSKNESNFCITKKLLGDRNIIILHPGPVHRNIDIDDAILEDSRCKVLKQVENGVFIRMAVLKKLLFNNNR